MILLDPLLPRIHLLESGASAVVELEHFFTEDHISLLIMGQFEKDLLYMKLANFICVQPGSHPSQRVLWIRDEEIIAIVENGLKARVKMNFPDTDFSSIRAFTVFPSSGEVAYLIPKELFSMTLIEVAFAKVIIHLPPKPIEV